MQTMRTENDALKEQVTELEEGNARFDSGRNAQEAEILGLKADMEKNERLRIVLRVAWVALDQIFQTPAESSQTSVGT